MVSIRGATTIDRDDPAVIISNTRQLLKSIIASNDLDIEMISAIFFTCTKDITSAYPAKAARDMGIMQAALMCLQEMHVPGSLEKCIRVCVFYNEMKKQQEVKHIYLNEAVILRQDLVDEKNIRGITL